LIAFQVEFDAPVGYKEPERKPRVEEQMEVDPSQFINHDDAFYTFKGEGTRLDGKKIKDSTLLEPPAHLLSKYVRGVPDHDHNIFELKFDRSRPKDSSKAEKDQEEFKKFQGEGLSLRAKK
jgi:ubiquitin fusion degradation protein 1